MKSKTAAIVFLLPLVMMTSCATLNKMMNPYEVVLEEDPETIVEHISDYEINDYYLKKFKTKDSMGFWHEVIIYDEQYMKIDDNVYAYKYYNLMYYELSLNIMGNIRSVNGTEKIVGIQGYAKCVSTGETVSFIFARDLFAKRHYRSMHEASEIDGIYFAGRPSDGGYIDSFGYWKEYSWEDYYEQIFMTTNRDVKMKMYMVLEKKR